MQNSLMADSPVEARHSRNEKPGVVLSSRQLPLACPNCQRPIALVKGLCGNRQVDVILLQAERVGAELECRDCGLRFVFLRTRLRGIQRCNLAVSKLLRNLSERAGS